MRILVSTDGQMNAERATDLVGRLLGPEDSITLLTVIDHPGAVLRSFADIAQIPDIDKILGDIGPSATGFGSGGIAAQRMGQQARASQGIAEPLDKYFSDTATRLQARMLEHFAASNIEAEAIWRATERRTARTILETREELGADILIIGSHGRGRFEGRLGSTVTKLVRLAEVPVLVVK